MKYKLVFHKLVVITNLYYQ